jgi:hypothetical protein
MPFALPLLPVPLATPADEDAEELVAAGVEDVAPEELVDVV